MVRPKRFGYCYRHSPSHGQVIFRGAGRIIESLDWGVCMFCPDFVSSSQITSSFFQSLLLFSCSEKKI